MPPGIVGAAALWCQIVRQDGPVGAPVEVGEYPTVEACQAVRNQTERPGKACWCAQAHP